jgi:class 3 adenylate cyclase
MSFGVPDLSCPRCEASIPAGARFCMACGARVDVTIDSDRSRQASLSSAAPTPLIEKMRAAKLTGERKPVTALFVDVVGSTALLEQMDPEDWTEIINEAFDLMSAAVFRYEGTIAQLQGDAMLAFFGAPVAHEDDPERAVLAALDMIAAVEELTRELKVARDIDFRIRAGIDTGPVLVGNVGSDLRYEYTALGDAVNVAARVQAIAEPGSVLITGAAHRLLSGQFDVRDLGQIEVKGKTEPVHILQVLGRRSEAGPRRGLDAIGIQSPMVGRDEHLQTLIGLLEIVRAGRGRLCFLLGEPGIGKSRLLAELKRLVVDDHHDGTAAPVWIEGRCVSYGRSLPYHLLLDIVRALLALPPMPRDGASAREAFDRQLAALLGDEASDIAPYLAHLMELPLRADEADRANGEPEQMQSRYAASVHRLLRALSRRGPVVLVCEDVHWADPASVEVLRQVLPLAAQLPVLLIGSMRLETDSPGWALLANARTSFGPALTEIDVRPLSEYESRELVANLLVIESLPDRVRDLILERADGNPFFVEEVVRMLIEHGSIEHHDDRWVAADGIDAVEIPDTLHGLLLARIDQLPDDARRSLRIAAVIGRRFPLRVLEQVLDASTS